MIARFVFQVERMPPFGCADVVVQPYDPGSDAAAVRRLMGRCAADPHGSAGPAVGTIAGELASRPGRQVWAWLARPGVDPDPAAVVGLVSLVGVEAAGGVRCSIGWLFVDPALRRRGVGRALVATAARQARSLGAAEIHAETLGSWPEAAGFWEAVRLATGGAVAGRQSSGERRKTAKR